MECGRGVKWPLERVAASQSASRGLFETVNFLRLWSVWTYQFTNPVRLLESLDNTSIKSFLVLPELKLSIGWVFDSISASFRLLRAHSWIFFLFTPLSPSIRPSRRPRFSSDINLIAMAPQSSETKPMYQKDEKALCFHGELLYEAKVLEVRRVDPKDKTSAHEYRVHYKGWKNT